MWAYLNGHRWGLSGRFGDDYGDWNLAPEFLLVFYLLFWQGGDAATGNSGIDLTPLLQGKIARKVKNSKQICYNPLANYVIRQRVALLPLRFTPHHF